MPTCSRFGRPQVQQRLSHGLCTSGGQSSARIVSYCCGYLVLLESTLLLESSLTARIVPLCLDRSSLPESSLTARIVLHCPNRRSLPESTLTARIVPQCPKFLTALASLALPSLTSEVDQTVCEQLDYAHVKCPSLNERADQKQGTFPCRHQPSPFTSP